MLKTYIALADGRVLSSGDGGEDAIVSVSITTCVNSTQQLRTGSVCAGMLETKLFGGARISAGDRLQVWRQDEGGTVYPLGQFIAEEPARNRYTLDVVAYDPVVLLDKDVTELLKQEHLQNCSLQVLAEEVCAFCGLSLQGQELPLGNLQVTGLSGQGITGRQVLGWIGELTGHFCRATAEGGVEFSWYEENSKYCIGPREGGGVPWENGMLSGLSGTVEGRTLTLSDGRYENGALYLENASLQKMLPYFQGSLCYEEYTVAPIQKVQLRKTADDVGTVFPDGLEGEKNTYVVEGNPLIGALPQEALCQVAEHLFYRMEKVSYTPCKVTLPASFHICPGDVVQVTDIEGKKISAYIMQKVQQGQKDTLECTGSSTQDSTSAVNNKSQADIRGKVMNLRTDLEGLMAEHTNTADKAARLELDMENIATQVSRQEDLQEKITQLEQTADAIKIAVEKLTDDGTDKIKTAMGYTFDDRGLHIHKEGGEIQNRLDESGMQVLRNTGSSQETVMLRADAQGVLATDVQVRNYLVIGSFSRVEDYGQNRTACFYLGGA